MNHYLVKQKEIVLLINKLNDSNILPGKKAIFSVFNSQFNTKFRGVEILKLEALSTLKPLSYCKHVRDGHTVARPEEWNLLNSPSLCPSVPVWLIDKIIKKKINE